MSDSTGPGDLPDGQNVDASQQDNGFEISEPPIGEHDTRPLKPLRPVEAVPEQEPVEPVEPPRATILQEAKPSKWLDRLPPSAIDETDRVRLLPRLPDPVPWRVILQMIQPGQTRIGLNVWKSLIIGRSDLATNVNPDLDMTPHQAHELGVSRQHAVLTPGNNALFLSDLESKNGTWVNGKYLPPGVRYPLSEGDQIEFGLIKLVVRTVSPLIRDVED
jgi:hypothetical protein